MNEIVKKINETYFPDGELTLHAFRTHMEAFMKQLLLDPTTADVDNFLKSHDISKKRALDLLLYKPDPKNERSAVMMCVKRIQPEDLSEEDLAAGKTPRDNFSITYKLPREDYRRKIRSLYIKNFESNIINEDYDYERMLSATPPIFKSTNEKIISQCKPGSTGDR